jgi:ABC-type branched-subunit amino acid transport system substrate-binding protein
MKKLLTSFLLIFFIVAITSCTSTKVDTTKDLGRVEQYEENFEKKDFDTDSLEITRAEQEAIQASESVDIVKIAILLPLSGKHSKVGTTLLESAQMAIFDSKKENLVLMPFDTKGTAFGAMEAIKQAVREDVNVVLGPLFTSSTKAVTEIARANGIRILSFSNNQGLLDSGVYLMGFSPEQEIERIVSYSIDEGKMDFVALVPNNKYGASISKILKETASNKDGRVIRVEYYSPSGRNLAKNIKRIQDAYGIKERVYEEYEVAKQLALEGKTINEEGEIIKIEGEKEEVQFIVEDEDKIYPEVVLIPEAGKKLDTIVTALGTHNKNEIPYQYVGTSQWDTYSTFSNNKLINAWFVSGDADNYNDFENDFYKVYGQVPLRISSLSYDAIMVVNEIVNKERDALITHETLTRHQGFSGIDGRFRFLPNGLVERQFTVIKVEDGGLEIVDTPSRKFMRY